MTYANMPDLPTENKLLLYSFSGKFRWHRRALLLLILLSALFFLLSLPAEGYTTRTIVWQRIGFFLLITGPIGINLYVLIPRFLFKNKYGWYLTGLIGGYGFFFGIHLFCRWVSSSSFSLYRLPNLSIGVVYEFLFYTIILSMLSATTAAWQLFQRWLRDGYRLAQLENSLVRTELALLKTNISPHFLFNMLNNAEVLTQTDPLMARQLLSKLADFLRYQLYDSSREKVLLSADILFLDQYLALEKIRRDQFDYTIKQQGTDRPVEVAPLLFIPFVENAVKHNLVSWGAYVHLSFTLTANELLFTCRNSVDRTQTAFSGGLGLETVYRRLDLLYPNRHQLVVEDQSDSYTVKLTISL